MSPPNTLSHTQGRPQPSGLQDGSLPSLSPTFAQVTVGGGTPVALHHRVMAAPSVAVMRTGPSSILGGTGKEEKHLSLRGQGHIHQRESGALQLK